MGTKGVGALRTAALIGLFLCGFVLGPAVSPATAASAPNPIQAENTLPGDSFWKQHTKLAPPDQIAGYTSEVSVAPAGTLHLHISSPQSYRIEIDRLGWYSGLGGRRVACMPSCSGSEQGQAYPIPTPDPTTGELDAGWPVTDTVTIGANWTTGLYIAMFVLTSGPDAGQVAYYPFVVTPPAGAQTDILVQVPFNTWEAYNPWPGASAGGRGLYGYNSAGGKQAVKVSFNRPLMPQYQAPGFGATYQAVRWLERNGYNLGYYTDFDVDQNPGLLLADKVDMVDGHDEYWTMGMRQGWDQARSSGHNLVFLGADIGFWQVRYEDSGRTLVGYKFAAPDPEPNPELRTLPFRQLPNPPMPECQLEGVEFRDSLQHMENKDYTVTSQAAGNPWIAAAGLQPGDLLPNAIGYEWDEIRTGCLTPPLTDLFHFTPTSTKVSPADAVTFTDPSGAQVFSAGSMTFARLLDPYGNTTGIQADPQVQSFMSAMLNSFTG